jgi:glutathione synthase/RimK-type ligase-like ATP-grasp enzyme
MILICGLLGDALIELMCARLNDLGYDYLFFDQLQFPGAYNLSWQFGRDGLSGFVSSPQRKVDLAEVTGVYARYVNHRGGEKDERFSKHEREMILAEYQLSLMQLLDLLPCTVVNRARASVSNDSKVYQSFLAESVGLRTPRTLVTTDPDQAKMFYEACGRQVIYKSLSSVRSVVSPVVDADLSERIRRVVNCPTQFQEVVEGIDIRVHTVGSKVFATEIASDASDYRYAGRDGRSLSMRAIDLPPEIEKACLSMARSLGLVLSGVDLRRSPEGEYYCFEVNPSPGFIFYERMTGQPISEAVGHLLRKGDPERARLGLAGVDSAAIA